MPRPESNRERRERTEKFQTFNRPKIKATRFSESGTVYVDYKDTETLRRLMSNNGKILSRKRSGMNAMEQRMVCRAVKRARFMALVPYAAASA
jgi:small subunit ribosomal protein S18